MAPYWKESIKEAMKKKGMSNVMLATAIGLSPSGLKKIFQKHDLSLERFRQICTVLDLDAAEVVKKDMNAGLKIKRWSGAAENYLLKEANAFAFYFGLSSEQLPIEEARQRVGITKSEAYRHLKKFDEFSLLRWQEGDTIVYFEKSAVLIDRSSKAAMKFIRTQAHALVDDCYNHDGQAEYVCTLRYMPMTTETFALVTARLKEELAKITREHAYPRPGETTKRVRFFFGAAPSKIPLRAK